MLVAVLAAVLAGPAGGALAQPASGCGGMFPGTEWDGPPSAAGPVAVYTTGIAAGLAERFVNDLRAAAEPMAAELGGLDGVEVCLFEGELPVDSVALGWPVGQRLRAVSFGPERVLVLSAWIPRLVLRAGAFGLAHQAEWGLAGGDYPSPLGPTIGHWYVSRIEARLERDRNVMRFANLIRELPDAIPWTEASIPENLLWNPEFQLSPIGDFAGFVVENEGFEVLRNPDAATLRRLEQAWHAELLTEATGSASGTKGWMVGVAIVGGVLAFGAFVALVNLRAARRRRVRATERLTVPVVEDEPVSADT